MHSYARGPRRWHPGNPSVAWQGSANSPGHGQSKCLREMHGENSFPPTKFPSGPWCPTGHKRCTHRHTHTQANMGRTPAFWSFTAHLDTVLTSELPFITSRAPACCCWAWPHFCFGFAPVATTRRQALCSQKNLLLETAHGSALASQKIMLSQGSSYLLDEKHLLFEFSIVLQDTRPNFSLLFSAMNPERCEVRRVTLVLYHWQQEQHLPETEIKKTCTVRRNTVLP